MIRVVVADDHHVVRAGLRALLAAEPDVEVVAEAADGLKALELVERLRPDVLVVDVAMPGLGGLEVARQTRQRSPRTQVVVQSMHSAEGYVTEALRHGAAAYVLKGGDADDLIAAVRAAAAGRRYLSGELSERALDLYVQRAQAAREEPYDALTEREREVLQLAAQGHTLAEIGAQLSMSPRTAETHRANLMRKLGLRTQTDLIRFALRRGLLPDEDPAGPV